MMAGYTAIVIFLLGVVFVWYVQVRLYVRINRLISDKQKKKMFGLKMRDSESVFWLYLVVPVFGIIALVLFYR